MKRQGWMATGMLALILLAGPAAAQVHKCEMPDGSTSYTSEPCPTGEAQPLRGISVTPGASREQQREMDRQRVERQRAASDRRLRRVEEATDKVRTIQRENADPEKCAAARAAIARADDSNLTRAEFRYRTFEYRTKVDLYCNP